MKVQSLRTKEVFDFEANIARAFIASGTHIAYVDPKPVRVPNTTWKVVWLPAQQFIPREPAITAECKSCDGKILITGPNAHRTQSFRHCGVTEPIPRHIAAQYAGVRTQMADEEKTRKQAAQVKKPAFINVF